MTVAPEPATTPIAWSAVVVSGPEAESFLSGQLTQDVTGLEGPRWSLVLQPDSTVVAPVWVTRVGDDLALVLERDLAETTLARLARFRLRVACSLELVESVEGPYATLGERVGARWPGAPEVARGLTPHGLGRRVLEATVSFTKGCYTGQELVERVESRKAAPPRRLFPVVVSEGWVSSGEELFSHHDPVGKVSSVAELSDEQAETLAGAFPAFDPSSHLLAWCVLSRNRHPSEVERAGAEGSEERRVRLVELHSA